MNILYFVRHAQSDLRVREDLARPLTEKGQRDTTLVSRYLSDKEISLVASSPCRRAIDTVSPFAAERGLGVQIIPDLAERRVGGEWIADFEHFSRQQWTDFDYALPGGESLRQVQARNLAALRSLTQAHPGQNIAMGSHGTALCALIHHFQPDFGYADFQRIQGLMPWIVVFTLEKDQLLGLRERNLFTGEERVLR